MPLNDICMQCIHYWGDNSCNAFPDRIPDEIMIGDNLHSEKLPNQQNNIVFEPIDKILNLD
jgi:hypothetical protein